MADVRGHADERVERGTRSRSGPASAGAAAGVPANGVSPARRPWGAGALTIESVGRRYRAAGRSWKPRGGYLPKNMTPTRGWSARRRTPRTSE